MMEEHEEYEFTMLKEQVKILTEQVELLQKQLKRLEQNASYFVPYGL